MATRGGKKLRAKNNANHDKTQNKQVRSLDDLAAFDDFKKKFVPKLRKMAIEGWSPERIRKEFAPMMQAIMIQKGFEGNFAALKDTLDRHEGTAVQRVEQKTTYQKMDKREKVALMLQMLKDAGVFEIPRSHVKVLASEEED